jgi:RNA polymerase sigma-70 factor (ECF subfamily)
LRTVELGSLVLTDEISDAALAQRIARTADGEAEAELCRRFAHRIRLYGLRHLGSDAMADDLVQQVLVLAIESLRDGRVREPERLASFILGSCRMVTRDARRASARRERLLERFSISVDVDPERPAALDLQRLRACIEKLPSRERTIVLLTFYADRLGEEIASELSMTLGNVRVVRRRAVEHLQACMGVGQVDQ